MHFFGNVSKIDDGSFVVFHSHSSWMLVGSSDNQSSQFVAIEFRDLLRKTQCFCEVRWNADLNRQTLLRAQRLEIPLLRRRPD